MKKILTHLVHLPSIDPADPVVKEADPWLISTPEEEGMDSSKLVEMVSFYEKTRAKKENILIDSITIVRNGRMVADLYFNPLFPKNTRHIIHSCTKSIVSALIGIAIEKGIIESVNVPVLDFFDDVEIGSTDDRLRGLTLAHLLTMQTGLRSNDSYLYQWRGLFKMMATDDWIKYILSLPMDVKPGIRHDYSNMSSFLLSAILTKASGKDTLSFAKTHLFNPLGIKDIRWEKSPQGIYIGWARMWLKPHDMAKIGWLYLQDGRWGKHQIIPVRWVKDSTTAHSYPKEFRRILDDAGKVDYRTTIGSWLFANLARPFSDGYGYQWWLDKRGHYAAVGVGGQFIFVVPDENLVVVFTSKLSGADSFFPVKLLNNYILSAIVSKGAIPANSVASNELSRLSERVETQVDGTAVPPLPAKAPKISGVTYALETNPWRYDNFQLTFNSTTPYAEFRYTVEEKTAVAYQIGLDDTYRLTPVHDDTYAAKGSWTAPNTFCIDYERVGYSNRGRWRLTFENNEVIVEEVGVTGTYIYRGRSKQNKLSGQWGKKASESTAFAQ